MPPPEKPDPELLRFARNAIQRQRLQEWIEHGSHAAASRVSGCDPSVYSRIVSRVKGYAAQQGYSPEHDMTHTAPDTHIVKGTSTLYGDDGAVRQQWVKTDINRERLEEMAREFIAASAEEIKREPARKLKTSKHDADLCNLYVLTDYHMGMLAWGEETRGDDWDVSIAEDLLVRWFRAAIDQSPRAQQAVAGFLGDGIHYDGFAAVTPASGHQLDSDTRYPKIVRTWVRARRRIMRMLLDKYPHVVLIEAEGNHSPATDAVMREWWAAVYEDEPRVTVDTSPDPYYCVEWGKTSLFFHHGHRRKPQNIHDVFAAKFREVFGRTKHSYAHMGHLHHRDVKETNLMVVEQHRTLAAADAYASSHGWISGREAQCITYHAEYGEVGRVVITPEMLGGAAA
jgi:hypothetical protein